MRKALCLLAVGLVGLTACGSKPSALEQTQSNMAKLTSGRVDLELSARAGADETATGPVGFRLSGPFSLEGKHLAVFALEYKRLLGDTSETTKVTSTGTAAFVDTGTKTYRVAEEDLSSLRLEDNPSGGINDLGIAGWVHDPKTERSGDAETIRGTVDVGDMLSDLARIAGSVGGEDGLSALGGDDGARLQRLVKSSSIAVVTSAKHHQLQSLRAVVDFGTRSPAALKRTLGKYAQARIEVHLSMKPLAEPLRVQPPSDYVSL
jgi:hypothetical protein